MSWEKHSQLHLVNRAGITEEENPVLASKLITQLRKFKKPHQIALFSFVK